MNREDIIRMANSINEDWWLDDMDLEAFAQLVAAAEREACAKECEKNMEAFPDFGDYCKGGVNALTVTAKTIRARGQQ